MEVLGKINNLKEAEEVLRNNLKLPFVKITPGSSIADSVTIHLSLTPESEWYNHIFQNGKSGIFHIFCSGQREKENDTYHLDFSYNSTGVKIRRVKGDLNKVVGSFIHQFEEGTKQTFTGKGGIMKYSGSCWDGLIGLFFDVEEVTTKEVFTGKGGGRLTEKDFKNGKTWVENNTKFRVRFVLEKLKNPTAYRVTYYDNIDEFISSYTSPNIEDVIYEITTYKTEIFTGKGGVKKIKAGDIVFYNGVEHLVTRITWDDRIYIRRDAPLVMIGNMPEFWVKAEDLKSKKTFTGKGGEFIKCSVGTVVQSVLLHKDHFTEEEAKAWVKKHDFKTGIDIKKNYYRFRQAEPDEFKKGSFRTIEFGEGKGIKAVIGCPKNEQYKYIKERVGAYIKTIELDTNNRKITFKPIDESDRTFGKIEEELWLLGYKIKRMTRDKNENIVWYY